MEFSFFESIFDDAIGEFPISISIPSSPSASSSSSSSPSVPTTPTTPTPTTIQEVPQPPPKPKNKGGRPKRKLAEGETPPRPRVRRDPNEPRHVSKREKGETLCVAFFVCRLVEASVEPATYARFISITRSADASAAEIEQFITGVDILLHDHPDLIKAIEGLLPPHHPRYRSFGLGFGERKVSHKF